MLFGRFCYPSDILKSTARAFFVFCQPCLETSFVEGVMAFLVLRETNPLTIFVPIQANCAQDSPRYLGGVFFVIFVFFCARLFDEETRFAFKSACFRLNLRVSQPNVLL